jgi:hypothetical protein
LLSAIDRRRVSASLRNLFKDFIKDNQPNTDRDVFAFEILVKNKGMLVNLTSNFGSSTLAGKVAQSKRN